jgi:hypothetical protein
MAETIACLRQGTVHLLDGQGRTKGTLVSQHREPGVSGSGAPTAPIVSITRGQARGELYYAIRVTNGTALFAQMPGVTEEQQLFLGVDTQIAELDFSFGDGALACTVPGPRGTSAIGSLADDGKGVRTVTEGDVVDCTPHWAPGGRAEIFYASAGIGRTRSGAWGGLSPFSLHRLRFADNSVEVLTSDARYDYLAPISITDSLLYAIRRPYIAPARPSPLSTIFSALKPKSGPPALHVRRDPRQRELVCITPQGVETVANGVLAFDIGDQGELVFATPAGVFRSEARAGVKAGAEPLATLDGVDELAIS